MDEERDVSGRAAAAVVIAGVIGMGASLAGSELMAWREKRRPGGSLDASNSLSLTAGWFMWTIALFILALAWGATFTFARRRRTWVVSSLVAAALVATGLIGMAV